MLIGDSGQSVFLGKRPKALPCCISARKWKNYWRTCHRQGCCFLICRVCALATAPPSSNSAVSAYVSFRNYPLDEGKFEIDHSGKFSHAQAICVIGFMSFIVPEATRWII